MMKLRDDYIISLGNKELSVNCERQVRRIMLQLFRFKECDLTDEVILQEIKENVSNCNIYDMFRLRHGLEHGFGDRSRFEFKIVSPSTARLIHTECHYLHSYRDEGIHLGLFAQDDRGNDSQLMSFVTVSPLDVPHLVASLGPTIEAHEALLLSRLFAVDNAPHNSISFTLSRLRAWVSREMPHVKVLLTYLDPNLGFTGSAYKASGWTLYGEEQKTAYYYLDGKYVTMRQLIRDYRTADFSSLRNILGDRISRSQAQLEPLRIYAYNLENASREFRNSSRQFSSNVGEKCFSYSLV